MKVTPVGRRATIPRRKMAGGSRLSRARIPAAQWLLRALGARRGRAAAGDPRSAHADGCLNRFTPGCLISCSTRTPRSETGPPSCAPHRAPRPGLRARLLQLQRLQSGAGGIAARRRGGRHRLLLPHQLPLRAELRVQVRAQGGFHQLPHAREVYRSYRELRTQGFRGSKEEGYIWGDSQKGLVIGSLREASERSLEESPIRS